MFEIKHRSSTASKHVFGSLNDFLQSPIYPLLEEEGRVLDDNKIQFSLYYMGNPLGFAVVSIGDFANPFSVEFNWDGDNQGFDHEVVYWF